MTIFAPALRAWCISAHRCMFVTLVLAALASPNIMQAIYNIRLRSAASDLAMAAPIPFDAPVTTATLPDNLLMSLLQLEHLDSCTTI